MNEEDHRLVANRFWLDVPYDDKNRAKAAGARWDPSEQRWYAPRPGMTELAQWLPLPDIPDLLPGEDRQFGAGLFVDLVPSSCWFTNVRSCVAQQDWERMRRMIVRRAESRCEACDRGEHRPTERWLEAHERWVYDDTTSTQTLRRLICLCTDCHRATHFGLAQLRGHADEAFAHLQAVTGMNTDVARVHIAAAFEVQTERSHRLWHLDLSMLTNAGITLTPPPRARNRADIARTSCRSDNR